MRSMSVWNVIDCKMHIPLNWLPNVKINKKVKRTIEIDDEKMREREREYEWQKEMKSECEHR